MDFYGLPQWFKTLNNNDFICTPNQRLVRFYQAQFHQYQLAKGNSQYPALNCMALDLWQSELWRKSQMVSPELAGILAISPLQKRALWQGFLAGDDALWAAGDLLDAALDADRLLKNWALKDVADQSDEYDLLQSWQQQYQAELGLLAQPLSAAQITDKDDQLNLLITALADVNLSAQLPKRVIFSGFDQWPQPLQRFESALTQAGVQVVQHRVLAVPTPNAKRAVFSAAKAELFAAAQWAYKAQQQGHSVAVVVPDLGQRLAEVERVFQQVFDPESVLPTGKFDEGLLNISSGRPLAQCPLIAQALRVLAWQGQALAAAELRAVLLSPFIGNFKDLGARTAMLDVLANRYPKISLNQLKAAAAEQNQSAEDAGINAPLGDWHKLLDDVSHYHGKANHSAQLPSEWLTEFNRCLTAWQWPGSRTLSSAEYQQHESWLGALAEFVALDKTLGPIDGARAQKLLSQVLKNPFHKQTPPAKVQILGVLEAAGQLFDGIWWLGLDSHTWPEPLKPNPLLPAALQRQAKMPRADAGAEHAYAQSITQRLCASAPEVIVSHAAFNGEEPLSPSPLIEAIVATDIAEPVTLHPLACVPTLPLESINDASAPALPVPQALKGGVGVFKRQAACPFQAFAVHRLDAQNLEPAEEGIDARDKGNLIHEVLEFIWNHLGSHQQLIATAEADLNALINEAINAAIAKLAKGRKLGARLLEVESQRIFTRVLRWLEHEKAREPFTVQQQEKTLQVTLNGLQLKLRMDRVDVLADGKSLAVIDYKTGTSNIKSWQWPRIEEPQIPLYATILPDVGAAMFAQVNTQDMKYLGLTSVPEQFSALAAAGDHKDWPDNFTQVLEQWRQELQIIAAQFVAGDARVAPKNNNTCTWCDLYSLCRIAERNRNMDMDDEVPLALAEAMQ